MRTPLALAALLSFPLACGACGGPLPAAENVPQVTASAGSADASVSLDAGAPKGSAFHTMTVVLCARIAEGCGAGEAGASYRVSFGTGTGGPRSREQARADLYREIRDRTELGTRLIATVHHLEPLSRDAGSFPSAPSARPSSSDADPLIAIAFDLMDSIDRDGQLTLDVSHGQPDCKLILATEIGDAGARRCLLRGPSHRGSHDDEGPRQTERRRGL